jgi:hypothetical protein
MHEGQAYVALEISFTRDSSWLKISDGEPFACLPSKIVLKLKRLMLSACIEVDAVTSTNALRKARLDWKKSGSSTKLKVDLNVYGHSQFAKTTAAILSSARLFLQPPNYEPRCLAYENPQYLRLPDLDEADFTSLDMPGSTKDSNEDTSQGLASEVEIILDHLPQPRFLREIQADERVITKLEKYVYSSLRRCDLICCRYQMEAVDFMTRREICDLPPSLSLWKLHVSKNGLVG